MRVCAFGFLDASMDIRIFSHQYVYVSSSDLTEEIKYRNAYSYDCLYGCFTYKLIQKKYE